MKNLMKLFACLLAVAMACCTLTACGGDDDDDPNGTIPELPSTPSQTVKELLIGTWEIVWDDSEIERYEIRKDGTGYAEEIHINGDNSEKVHDSWNFTWFYDEETKFLKIVSEDPDDDDGYDLDTFLVSEINSSMIIAYWVDNETLKPDYTDRWILKRIK